MILRILALYSPINGSIVLLSSLIGSLMPPKPQREGNQQIEFEKFHKGVALKTNSMKESSLGEPLYP